MMTTIEPKKSRSKKYSYRILVLTGNKDQLDEITTACRDLDQEVVPVSTIRQSTAFLESKNHVDLVIADAFLEDESIFDFLQHLRKKPDHDNVPVVLIATKPRQIGEQVIASIEKAAQLLGAYKLVYMPDFDIEHLMGEINTLLPRDTIPK